MAEQSIEKTKEELTATIKKMVDFMNLDCQVDVTTETDDRGKVVLAAAIYAPGNGNFLIGKNGQNLKSLEQLLKAIFLRKNLEINSISVDVNDYKKSRADFIINLARQAVTRVRSNQRAEALLPMSGYERRIVHVELASYPDIATESIGAEPNRRIVIKPL